MRAWNYTVNGTRDPQRRPSQTYKFLLPGRIEGGNVGV